VTEDTYRVFIDASFEKGSLKVGECTIPGERPESIALVAHLDHPAQANDDLSGVSVLTSIARHLLKQKNAYTYRLFFVPETIGSIALLSQKSELTDIIKSGLFLEMLGNNRRHSLQHTYRGNTRLDRIAVSVIRAHDPDFTEGAFRKIVSNDEAVFNGPGVNIPMISVSRAEPGIPHYPEYHTSDDTPEILSEERLTKSRDMVLDILKIIDADYVPKRTFKGPIFLSKYGLWVDWRTNHAMNKALELITFLLEGDLSVFDIAERVDVDFWEVKKYLDRFHEHGLITKSPPASE
jgi:aminopeptidase-like protein